jgi:hypothetical protein
MAALFASKLSTSELQSYPQIAALLPAFRDHFQITWFSLERTLGTEALVFLLKPLPSVKATFGLNSEIPLFFFRFDDLQPRTVQFIEVVCKAERFSGRIDPTVAFISAPQDRLREWCADFVSQNIQSRVLVALTEASLRKGLDDRWEIKNQLKDQFFIRDFFNYKLPIQSDTFFYGREIVVNSILDDIRKSQNSGLFGLRKTGKTTVLLRVERLFRRAKLGTIIKLDCQNRPIRRSNADAIATKIIKEIDGAYGKNFTKRIGVAADTMDVLQEAIRSTPKNDKVCVVFDEVEYVTPLSPTDAQWSTEYLDLFQSLRAIQTETQKLCVVVCGVNPTICDVDRFPSQILPDRTVQNPLFGIVNVHYLQGFELPTFIQMAQFFGSRMGLQFTDDALEYLWDRYGGHPLLSRLACSFHHTQLLSAGIDRPIRLDRNTLRLSEEDRDVELSSYCEHVLSEMREFYGKEYDIVEAISFEDASTVLHLGRDTNAMRHLRAYGLVEDDDVRAPTLRMPVIARYLKSKRQSESASGHWRKVVPSEDRAAWLARRKQGIMDDIEILNDELRSSGSRSLFPGGSPRKASEFMSISVASTEPECNDFLVKANKVLVENIDRSLRDEGASFFKEFASEHPALFDALVRIRMYRHFLAHLELDAPARQRLAYFRQRDFDGSHPKDVDEGWYQVQQICLDNVHAAIQRELARL